MRKIDKNNQFLKEQINSSILQIEDEYYANARVKSKIISNQRSISKLKHGGVDFIELRSLDLNPFNRIGIDKETVMFLEVFLIFCFFKGFVNFSRKDIPRHVSGSNDTKTAAI